MRLHSQEQRIGFFGKVVTRPRALAAALAVVLTLGGDGNVMAVVDGLEPRVNCSQPNNMGHGVLKLVNSTDVPISGALEGVRHDGTPETAGSTNFNVPPQDETSIALPETLNHGTIEAAANGSSTGVLGIPCGSTPENTTTTTEVFNDTTTTTTTLASDSPDIPVDDSMDNEITPSDEYEVPMPIVRSPLARAG